MFVLSTGAFIVGMGKEVENLILENTELMATKYVYKLVFCSISYYAFIQEAFQCISTYNDVICCVCVKGNNEGKLFLQMQNKNMCHEGYNNVILFC